jgi:hypothetical protein
LTTSTQIPEAYLKKISDYQKKGGCQNFEGMVSSIAGLRDNCALMLNDARKEIDAEEMQDNSLRAQLAPKWSPIPSASMNGAYKQNIALYA